MSSKLCKSCQQVLPRTEFYKHGGFRDGLNCNCKHCERELNRHRARARAATRGTVSISEKSCSACKVTKPSQEFYKDKCKKYGLSSSCKSCSGARAKAWVLDNPERANVSLRKRMERKRGYRSSYFTFWLATSGYDKPAADKAWYESNRDHARRYRIEYRKTPRGRALKNESNRRCRIVEPRAFPQWADRDAILLFYQNCPKGYDVDHVVPMRGRNVCGLHVLENLQYLPHAKNSRKGNRFDPAEVSLPGASVAAGSE